MGLLKPFIIAIIALWILDFLFPNITISSWVVLVAAGLVLGIIQLIIRPALSILLLPFTIISFGLFSTILNVALLWLITAVVPGFHIDPLSINGYRLNYYVTLALFSFLISLVQWVLYKVWRT